MPNNALATYAPTNDVDLSRSLMGMEIALEAAARRSVELATDGEDYTQAEIHAMIVVEELKKLNGMDLAAVLMRYKIVKQIESEALWTIHPGHYDSRDAMAREQGISPSELSDIMAMGDIVFPYIENTMDIRVAVIWEQIGKSNFRELVPIIKYIVTGEMPTQPNQSSRSAERMLDDVAATAQAAGQDMDDGEIRRQAISRLLEAGQHSNREMRAQIRPERTASINATYVTLSGRKFLMAEVDDDQETLLNRRMGAYIDAVTVTLPTDRRQRQLEGSRAPVLGSILRAMEE
jgi:hypothetical protein